MPYTLDFSQINLSDLNLVGGKNASLGEMFQELTPEGILVPDGFATTAEGYWEFLDFNNLREPLTEILNELDTVTFENLHETGAKIRALVMASKIPPPLADAIRESYQMLQQRTNKKISVAVRSSATAEDLPNASFAGQLETYLNIKGNTRLLETCLKCYASLFTDRAIKYRHDNGFEHMKVALSVGVQQMVRSDLSCAGVAFTLDPDSGFENVILLTGSWGLGENVVQGSVNLDEFLLFKPTLKMGKNAIISKILGGKEQMMIFAQGVAAERGVSVLNLDTPRELCTQLILNDEELHQLGRWCVRIEEHYKRPMDIEWAKDGETGQLYIVQARPETVHSQRDDRHIVHKYHLREKGKLITSGIGLGDKIAAGRARVLHSPEEDSKLREGEVLVTTVTNPDWDPILKKAAAIVTDKGGRTSHAAIVAREIGTVAVVGTNNATEVIKDGDWVTVSCADGQVGKIYQGKLEWEQEDINLKEIPMTQVRPMLILGDPEKAFQHSFLPSKGIGLLRLEFIINNSIGIHPMALVNYHDLEDKVVKKKIAQKTTHYENKEEFFVDKLSQSVGMLAAAFYPKPVIVRMSDFKSNEYANLMGGHAFEPDEENPMIGFRGASRYYSPRYREGFGLECKAMKRVRDEMGLTNIKLMIPFCRTVEEGEKVVKIMEEYGLVRGDNGLEIFVMAELPSNVMLADQFAEVFDGFSIGSNDLTQLTLGLDRDSSLVSDLFDENNQAVKDMISRVIKAAKEAGSQIGLCGQAPSDFPEFAQFLVDAGIDSISFTPDALIRGMENIRMAERQVEMA